MDFSQEYAFVTSRRRSTLDDITGHTRNHGLATAPLFTMSALKVVGPKVFPFRGLLGVMTEKEDLVYFNTNAPSSGVICGVQGSGKSHTVSCLLENALVVDPRIGNLVDPLAALVFHFDEEDGGRPCKAAYLGTPATDAANGPHVRRVTVLASSVNLANRRQAYANLENVDVQPLLLSEADITAQRLLTLMGWSDDAAEKLPLYLHIVLQIVREMGPHKFTYTEFKRRIDAEKLDPTQRMMLNHRLCLLDGFVQPASRPLRSYFSAGEMVLVDLTDPFLNGMLASLLFDIVLTSFMGWNSPTDRIVVLDEAHKYLSNNESARLSRSIATIIRQQQNLATRVIISTQDPTVISATILDLLSFVVWHRFSSPSWCSHLSQRVSTGDKDWFEEVMNLATGDIIVFSSTARIAETLIPLGTQALHISVRPRLTFAGGASTLAAEASSLQLSADDAAALTLGGATAPPSPSEMSIHFLSTSPNGSSPRLASSLPSISVSDLEVISLVCSSPSASTDITPSTMHEKVDDISTPVLVSSCSVDVAAHSPECTDAMSIISTSDGPTEESHPSDNMPVARPTGTTTSPIHVPVQAISGSSTQLAAALAPLDRYTARIKLLSLPQHVGDVEAVTNTMIAFIASLHKRAIEDGDQKYTPLDVIWREVSCQSRAGSVHDQTSFKEAFLVAEDIGLVTWFEDGQGRAFGRLMSLEEPTNSTSSAAAVFSSALDIPSTSAAASLTVTQSSSLAPPTAVQTAEPTASTSVTEVPTYPSTSGQADSYVPLEAYLAGIQPVGQYTSEMLPKVRGVVKYLHAMWVLSGERKAVPLGGIALGDSVKHLHGKLSVIAAAAQAMGLAVISGKGQTLAVQLAAVPPPQPSKSPAEVNGSSSQPLPKAALVSRISCSELGEPASPTRAPAPMLAKHDDFPSPCPASPGDTALNDNIAASASAVSLGSTSNAFATDTNSGYKATPVHTLPSSPLPIPPMPGSGPAYAPNKSTGISGLVALGVTPVPPAFRLATLQEYLEHIELLPSLLLPTPSQIRTAAKENVILLITELHKQALRDHDRNFIPLDRVCAALSCGSAPFDMAIDVAQKAALVTRLSDGHKHSFVRLMPLPRRTVTGPISSPAIASAAGIPPIDVYLSKVTSGGLAEPLLSKARALVQFLHQNWIQTGERQKMVRGKLHKYAGGKMKPVCSTLQTLGIVTVTQPLAGKSRLVQLNHL
ncbi:hypothetical protein BKA62DRAFT_179537 [Auriculariales sp. MPI-PUGE-AT-0066]|nr:hypothetical protein BKA62DRAFT_179537 [Auriculariales sp. MPI-PUGE-AT-0066]